ncbi:MAG: glycoside hydrolase, partial [Myxococcales bacterium]|nr:glycoside hydrolase [Myxococcales bacterium]
MKSQPRKRIDAARKIGAMPSADDIYAAQSAVLAEHKRVAATLPRPGRYARLGGAPIPQATGVPGLTWVNSGPADAAYEFNFSGVYGVDSGRPTAIVVDPRDPNVVYDAVSGGGVWKTYNFVTGYPTPTWIPVGDALPNLAVGALAIDQSAPDTVYLATGDSFDIGGNQVFKSTDGGATWGAPVALSGTAPGTATTFRPAAIRDLRVDPENGMNVLLASDQGLFRSTDAGATFSYVDLPNASADVMEATWSIAYLGNKQWLISGVQACDTANKARGPRAGFGQFTNAGCALGNLGDIWRSTDSGATWTSLRNTTGALPLAVGVGDDVGRMMIGVGPTTNPASTVAYIFVGNSDEYNKSYTWGIFRSVDGGKTFQDISGNHVVDNPTLATVFQGNTLQDCADLNIGHDQTWYNESILVDPQNADNVLFGGNLCGVRTRNGTSSTPTYENVSHWLPTAGGGTTTQGMLPYVHADWHAQAAFVLDGQTHAIAGTDGGVFSTSNLWDAKTTPPNINWANHNKGLANHLFYT